MVSFSLLNKLDLAIITALCCCLLMRILGNWFAGRESELEFTGTRAPSGYLIPKVVLSSRKFFSFEFSVCAWFCPQGRWEWVQ